MSTRRTRPFKLPCGCTVTVDIVEQFCAAHGADWAERHEQARRDHDCAQPRIAPREDHWHEGMGGDAPR